MRHLPLLLVLLAACGSEGAYVDDPPVSSSFATEAAAPPPASPAAPKFEEDLSDDAPRSGARDPAVRRAASTPKEREYHRGPRGGCYTYTESGNKRYVDRSLCASQAAAEPRK